MAGRAVGSRVLLILLGLVAAVVLLELGLQAAALYVRVTRDTAAPTWLTGRLHILALGDSNTYGLHLKDRSLAYPKVLERLWNEAPGAPMIDVLNLGFPATNSSRVRNALPAMLGALRPDVVTLMIGVNDFWTVPEPVSEMPAAHAGLETLLWRRSRVYRALYMMRRTLTWSDPAVETTEQSPARARAKVRVGSQEFAFGFDRSSRPQEGWAVRLTENIAAIAATTRQFGVPLILLTYPADAAEAYGPANRALREAAAKVGTPLIDIAAAFGPACRVAPCEEFYRDSHPTVKGHSHAAQVVLPALRWILDRGVAPRAQ